MIDPIEFGKSMGAIVRDATGPLLKRIDELEAMQPATASDVVKEMLSADSLAPLLDLMVAEAVVKHFEDNPVAPGKDGETGPSGEKGADGAGIADLLIDREGSLIATMTDGRMKSLGQVVGKDGNDGLGFDDADIAYDGERGFTITWQQGDRVKTKTFTVPTVIDRGYWREGTEAKTGDAMTHDGTLWIALCDTKAKPARESEDWRIGARKGRDGAPGPAGKAYEPPKPVKLGKDNG